MQTPPQPLPFREGCLIPWGSILLFLLTKGSCYSQFYHRHDLGELEDFDVIVNALLEVRYIMEKVGTIVCLERW